jgi:hypothetical protein
LVNAFCQNVDQCLQVEDLLTINSSKAQVVGSMAVGSKAVDTLVLDKGVHKVLGSFLVLVRSMDHHKDYHSSNRLLQLKRLQQPLMLKEHVRLS